MKKLIEHTCDLLPELAKMHLCILKQLHFQKRIIEQKLVLDTTKDISLDLSGIFIKNVAEMCAKLFVVWR